MILHNKTGILVLYEAGHEAGELFPNEEVALALPADGVLHLCLRLPYGSMQQGANTGKRWLDRIFHKLSISQWDFAVVSEYVLGGLSMHSVVEVTRLKEDFDTASLNSYDCLFATCVDGRLLRERHEVPDGKAAVKGEWRMWRRMLLFLFLIYAGETGVMWLLGLGIVSLFSLESAATIWLFILGVLGLETLLFLIGLAVDMAGDELHTPFYLAKKLKSKAITKHFRGEKSRRKK